MRLLRFPLHRQEKPPRTSLARFNWQRGDHGTTGIHRPPFDRPARQPDCAPRNVRNHPRRTGIPCLPDPRRPGRNYPNLPFTFYAFGTRQSRKSAWFLPGGDDTPTNRSASSDRMAGSRNSDGAAPNLEAGQNYFYWARTGPDSRFARRRASPTRVSPRSTPPLPLFPPRNKGKTRPAGRRLRYWRCYETRTAGAVRSFGRNGSPPDAGREPDVSRGWVSFFPGGNGQDTTPLSTPVKSDGTPRGRLRRPAEVRTS